MMVPAKQGLIVNISSVAGMKYSFNVVLGVGKAAVSEAIENREPCKPALLKTNWRKVQTQQNIDNIVVFKYIYTLAISFAVVLGLLVMSISNKRSSFMSLFITICISVEMEFCFVQNETFRGERDVSGFVENVSTRRWNFNYPSLLKHHSYQSSSRILRLHCISRTNWNNREVVTVVEVIFSSDVFVGGAIVVAFPPNEYRWTVWKAHKTLRLL